MLVQLLDKAYERRRMKYYHIVLLLLFFCIDTSPVFGQVWDMKYIIKDSINSQLIGREIRIDFKNSVNDTLSSQNIHIRGLIGERKQDTVTLLIDNRKFKEIWRHYPDRGILREQYLEQLGNNEVLIKEMYLLEINEENIQIEMWLYEDDVLEEKVVVDIPKGIVKGVITRIY